MKKLTPLLLTALLALCALAPALRAAPTPAHGTVRVHISYVEMSEANVRSLAVITPAITAARHDRAALLNAARRAHVSFVATGGPTLIASTGKTVTDGDITVRPQSVRGSRAQVLVRVERRVKFGHRSHVTHVIARSALYHSGDTRRLAGVRQGNGRYRYTFATVTVL